MSDGPRCLLHVINIQTGRRRKQEAPGFLGLGGVCGGVSADGKPDRDQPEEVQPIRARQSSATRKRVTAQEDQVLKGTTEERPRKHAKAWKEGEEVRRPLRARRVLPE